MSNNFDGPIILDSLADAGGNAGQGYLGTGGRTGEDSDGPRLSGGSLANQPGAATQPDGTLFMDQDTPGLWMAEGANWTQISSAASIQVTGVGQEQVAANPTSVTVATALPGDTVCATLARDDSGATLGAIIGCVVVGLGQVDVTFTNAPTNADGVVQVICAGTRQI